MRAANWVGDAVMSVPALQALRAQFPKASIAILAKPSVAELYSREPFCDELILYSSSRWQTAGNLRQRGFELAVLLPNSFDSAWIAWAARIPNRVGYRRDGRSWLLTQAIAVPKQSEIPTHQCFQYLELLRRAKLIESHSFDGEIRLDGSAAAAQRGRERFNRLGVNMPIVGVSPGAAYGTAKRWLPERFAQAAVIVARERAAAIAVFGSKEETQICAEVQRAVETAGERCLNLSGRTNLGAFIELIAACDMYLTNDSGPMHVASALCVPVVAVFGPTDEEATGPTGRMCRIVREQVECSPCLLRNCPIDHRCMTRVPAERVANAALSLAAVVHK